MLALRPEPGRRGCGEDGHLQKRATAAARHVHPPGRPPSHQQRVNIREKISQWEGRSQQASGQDAGVKGLPPNVSRRGEFLGSGSSGGGLPTKVGLSKAKILDFRECPSQAGHDVPLRKSDTSATGNKPLAKQIFNPNAEDGTADATGEQTFNANSERRTDPILDTQVASKPLPLFLNEQEDHMPAGNFYTSRGFWRKLEGDRLLWEKGKESSGDVQAPPKPLRTFQYLGTNNNNNVSHAAGWENGSPHYNRSNARSTRVAKPPSFPPPPCPVAKANGLSRHKNSR